MSQLRVVHSASLDQRLIRSLNGLIGDGYTGAWEGCGKRVCKTASRDLTSPAAYARPQLQKHADAVDSPTRRSKGKRWSDPGLEQSPIERPLVQFPPSDPENKRRAELWEEEGIGYRRESTSWRQTAPVEPSRPGPPHSRHDSLFPTTRNSGAIKSKNTRPAGEPPGSASGIAKEAVPASTVRGGAAALEKRSPGWGRQDREWLVWEQRERQDEATRNKRKSVEIAQRQQEVRERVAARQHFHSLNVRADEGLQAAQQAWDQELDRRLGGADLTKVPLPAINLVGRLIKWAIKRGDQQQRQDIRQRREEEVLRGHRMAFRSFLSDFTGRGSQSVAQTPDDLSPSRKEQLPQTE